MAGEVFVGRQRELALLSQLAAKARADHPQVALIEGDAGMGKSTLVARFLPELGDAAVLRASGDEAESNLGYGVVSQLANAARAQGVGTPPALADLDESLDPLVAGAELLSLFDGLGRTGQLSVLWVDDLHWCDPLSARALLFCLRRLLADRVLALVTARTGELVRHGESWYRLAVGDERATRLHLGPLATNDLMALSRDMGAGRLTRGAAATLLEHTGGNPLYCVALLQELGAEQLERTHGPPRVPKDLASLLLAKVSRLAPAAQELVMAAAVLGQRAPLDLIVGLAGTDDPLAALEQAVSASVLTEMPGDLAGTVSFVHPLVRSAVYHDLGSARRRSLHQRAAKLVTGERALAHRVAAATGPDEALACDLDSAAGSARRAGKTALAASLWAQAAGASSGTGPRERRLLDAFEAHLAGGDVAGAQALADLVERSTPSARRSALLGNLDVYAGRLDGAEQHLAEAWRALGPVPASLAGALCEQVTAYLMQGRGDEALLWGRRALEVAKGDASVEDRAKGLLALALAWSFRAREALDLADQLPAPVGKMAADSLDVLILRGIARLWAGYPELAHPDLSNAALCLRAGSAARYAGSCLTYLACAEYLLGAWDDALAHAELSVSVVHDAGYAMWSALAHHYATLVPMGRGDFAAAARHIEEANKAAGLLGGPWAGAVTAEAALAMARGEPKEALTAVTKVREQWQGKWFGPVCLLDWRSLEIEALVATGDIDVAKHRLNELDRLQGDQASPLARANAARLRALLAMRSGDSAAAARAFAQAGELARGLGVPILLAQLEMDEARSLGQVGQQQRAVALMRSATNRFSSLGARPYAELGARELAGYESLPPPGRARPELGLTATELAVARAVARGSTNKEAADELYVSVKTIEFHLSHIYMKLSLRSRKDLARLINARPTVPA